MAAMVKRELANRYRGSLFGRLWPLVTQVSQLLVFTYLFAAILKVRLHLPGGVENPATYGLWLFAAILPWNALSVAVLQATSSITGQSTLVKRVVFPLAILPLVPVFAAFLESLVGVLALCILASVVAHHVNVTILALPLIWVPQVLMTCGLAYLVSSLTVFIRDVPLALNPIFLVWFYLTPIVYPPEIIPPQMRLISELNPLTILVGLTRDLLIYDRFPSPGQTLALWIVAVAVFVVGVTLFRTLRPAFADVL